MFTPPARDVMVPEPRMVASVPLIRMVPSLLRTMAAPPVLNTIASPAVTDRTPLTVRASFAEGVVLETLALSILNHDSAIASAAARMVTAANGRRMIEMGSRRTHEEAAVACARASYLAGFTATSNLEAGRRHGIKPAARRGVLGGCTTRQPLLDHDAAAFRREIGYGGG